jgi:hypothetical protein
MSTLVAPSTYIGVPQRIIAAEKAEWQPSGSFAFRLAYNLAEHPLFRVSGLVKLANFIASKDPNKASQILINSDPISCNWSGQVCQNRFAKPIASNKETGSLILISNTQKEPEYCALVDRIEGELEEITGRLLRQQNTWLDTYIFISPVSSVSGYHSNNRENFLSCIHQERKVLPRQSNHSIFISSIHFPGKDRAVNLNLFVLESPSLRNDEA